MKLICLGDSLTYGVGVERSACWTAVFAQKSGWEILNRGVNGDTTGGMLARLKTDVLDYVERARLEGAKCRVLVMGGSNDIFFSGADEGARANMTAICHQLEAHGVRPLVGIPLPVDCSRTPKKWDAVVDFCRASWQVAAYADWVRRFSACAGLDAVDFFAEFVGELGAIRHELLLDGIHPNREGHQRMARRLCESLYLTQAYN